MKKCSLLLCAVSFYLLLISPSFAEDIFTSSAQVLDRLSSSVTKVTLSNGLRVLLYPRNQAPVFAGVISVGVGGVDETPGETGISHMFEHMAFKGTEEIGTYNYEKEKGLLKRLEVLAARSPIIEKLSAEDKKEWSEIQEQLKNLWNNEQLSREFEKRGGVGLNAQTDKEETRYFVSLPKNAFEFWCWLESERLFHPILRQFYQERDVVLEERRSRFEDDPVGMLYEKLLGIAYVKHPYRNPVIGYEQDIRNLTATKLEAFRKRFYIPSNIVVGIVGDIDLENDIATIKKYFGPIPSATREIRDLPPDPPQTEEKIFTTTSNASPSFMVAYHKPNYPSPDDPIVTVLSSVLNGSSQSPLFKRLIKDRRVATSISDEEVPGVLSKNLLLFVVTPKSTHSNKAVLAAFDEEIEDFKNKPVSKALLENAKRSVAFDYMTQLQSNMTLAGNLAAAELGYNDWKVMIDWYRQAMAVTEKDVQNAARKYLVRSSRIVGLLERKS